jgi:hypothetical protein
MPRKQFLWIILTGFLGGCIAYGSPPGHGGIPPGHGGIPPGLAKKMGPPAVVVVGSPKFVLIPGTTVSVVLGVDADLFVEKGVYYYFYDHVWYTGANHRGPWRAISTKDLPPGLRGKSPKELKAMVNGKSKGKRGNGRKWVY